MKLIDNGGTTFAIFDGPLEAVKQCNGRSFEPSEFKLGRRLPNWDEVVKAIDAPWKEGLAAVEKFVAELENRDLPEIKSIVRRIRYDENDGDEVDLDRMRAGQPFWRVSRREVTNGPTEVTIVTDLSATKDVSPTDILWRGAAAVAMAKILEDRGFRVCLWAVQKSAPYADCTWRTLVIAICLKDFGDRLDISTLVNGVSGWFYRSVLFTLTRTLVARQGKKIASGLGTPEYVFQSDLNVFTDPTNRLSSGGSFSFGGALRSTEMGLEQVKESQEPPVMVVEDDPIPTPTPVSQGPEKGKDPPRPKKPPKPIKVRKIKMPKRLTQD